jgi:erythrocyte band 7 integral membrane protein
VVQEYERAVIFRLGRLLKGGARGPGIFFIVPCIDTYRKIDLRTVSFDVPPQEVSTRFQPFVFFFFLVYFIQKICASPIIFIILGDASASFHLPLLSFEERNDSSFVSYFLNHHRCWGLATIWASIFTGDWV